MKKRTPFDVIKSRYLTEKARVLEGLCSASSNRSLDRCRLHRYLFLVDKRANKFEIAKAIEQIYVKDQIRVEAVNTIMIKPKKRRVRGFKGKRSGFKKAIVTFKEGCRLEESELDD